MSREEEKRNLISAGGGDDAAVASDEDSDSDFEFTVCSGSGSPPDSADPVYPVFDRNLLLDPPPPKSGLPSGSGPSSSTTAEEEKHLTWAPGSSPGLSKKSSSTGSAPSRRFKLRDLMSRRSHSDGREKLGSAGGGAAAAADQKEGVPKPSPNPNPNLKKKKKEELKPGEMDLLTAHRLFYGGKDGEKGVKGGKAYLPHRSGPVGLFPNGNALTRTKFPF